MSDLFLGTNPQGYEPHVIRRFWSKVDRSEPDNCWPWLGSSKPGGYGQFAATPNTTKSAHRTAYELTHGAIPVGMFVCHTCDNTTCCNPAHLTVGSQADNMRHVVSRQRRGSGSTAQLNRIEDKLDLILELLGHKF